MSEYVDRIAKRIELRRHEPGARLTNRTRWAEIRNSDGELTSYTELFWGGKLGWVRLPGASRVIDAGEEQA
jgi:hypothetical protein